MLSLNLNYYKNIGSAIKPQYKYVDTPLRIEKKYIKFDRIVGIELTDLNNNGAPDVVIEIMHYRDSRDKQTTKEIRWLKNIIHVK